MGKAPRMIRSIADCPRPWKMKVPKPPAPISAATAVRPIAWMLVTRTPSMINGMASGRRTWRNTWAGLMPMPRADSITPASTSCRATQVLRTIGSRL
ncbi:hypothetical protein D3C72_1987650 [compost metagenome]